MLYTAWGDLLTFMQYKVGIANPYVNLTVDLKDAIHPRPKGRGFLAYFYKIK